MSKRPAILHLAIKIKFTVVAGHDPLLEEKSKCAGTIREIGGSILVLTF